MSDFQLPEEAWPSTLPISHRELLRSILERFRTHPSLVGVAAGGSFASGSMDEFSDLDLVVGVTPEAWPGILDQRHAIVADAGPLLGAFTGEHVGEPRLLIALLGPPLVHVDFKFLVPEALAFRVEDPVVLWERDGAMSTVIAQSRAAYPQPDLQWIEDRFWIWVHYVATKIGRGELLEALDSLAFLRSRVLGPLLLADAGLQPNGVRRLDSALPHALPDLLATVAPYDRSRVIAATQASVALYRQLRDRSSGPLQRRVAAETAAVDYLEAQLLGTPDTRTTWTWE